MLISELRHDLQVTGEVPGQLETLLLFHPEPIIPTELSALCLPQSPRPGSSLVPKPHLALGPSHLPDPSLTASMTQTPPGSVAAMPLGLAGRPLSQLPPWGSPGAYTPLQPASMVPASAMGTPGSSLPDGPGWNQVSGTLQISADPRKGLEQLSHPPEVARALGRSYNAQSGAQQARV